MNHLLYSSNEMYSSTELIRKSKTIFDKIIKNEIDKAIILRDGKPSFILLDFDKYEKIMSEYDTFKSKSLLKETKEPKKKKEKVIVQKEKTKKKKEEISSEKNKSKKNIDETIKENKIKSSELVEEFIEKKKERVAPPAPVFEFNDTPLVQEDDEIIVEEILIEEDSEKKLEEEISQGLEVLEEMDFDEEFKKEVEKKVRERKKRELKEFWT